MDQHEKSPDDAGEDRGRRHGAGPVDMSRLSPAEFVREARRRKGLDPSRLTDVPDDPVDGEDDSRPEESSGGDAAASNGADAGAIAGATDRDVGAAEGSGSGARNERAGGQHESAGARGGPGGGGGPESGRVRVPSGMPNKWLVGSVRMGPLEPGVAGVGEALAALEAPAAVDDGCLQERTVDLLRVRSLVDSALASHVREWDNRALWAGDGSKSPTARLARDANVSRGSAGGAVRLAGGLARMPETSAALADGRISLDHARRLIEACTDERLALFLEAEAYLIAEGVRLAGNHRGFCRVVRHWELITDDKLHDPTDPDDEPPGPKRQRQGRDFQMPASADGFDIRGSLPTADGAIVWNQVQRIYDEFFEADWAAARAVHGDDTCTAHLGRSVSQRRADALVEMAKRASAYQPGSAIARPLITVLVHAPDLMGPLRETFNGVVLSRRDIAEWLTEADFERIVFDPAGKPVDITSPQRFFTGRWRRAVQIRDRMCSHPTCDVDAEHCQVDHIVEHSDGGPTNIDNARLLCPRHNQQRPGRAKKPPGRGDGDGGDGDGDDSDDSDSDGG